MSLKEFCKVLARTRQGAKEIAEQDGMNSKIWSLVNECSSIDLADGEKSVNFSVNSCMLSLEGSLSEYQQQLVLPTVAVYAECLRKLYDMREEISEQVFKELEELMDYLGKAVQELCMSNFSEVKITPKKVKLFKSNSSWRVHNLHHFYYSAKHVEFNKSESEELQEIRYSYEENFKVKVKYIYFYDVVLKKEERVAIDSPQAGYAVVSYMAKIYLDTANWLSERYSESAYDKTAPYRELNDMAYEVVRMFKN